MSTGSERFQLKIVAPPPVAPGEWTVWLRLRTTDSVEAALAWAMREFPDVEWDRGGGGVGWISLPTSILD